MRMENKLTYFDNIRPIILSIIEDNTKETRYQNAENSIYLEIYFVKQIWKLSIIYHFEWESSSKFIFSFLLQHFDHMYQKKNLLPACQNFVSGVPSLSLPSKWRWLFANCHFHRNLQFYWQMKERKLWKWDLHLTGLGRAWFWNKSQNHQGRKKPSSSSSPSAKPAPPCPPQTTSHIPTSSTLPETATPPPPFVTYPSA